jgi:hypothetical protein
MGDFENKRVIKIQGKVLAPLTSESPSLPIVQIYEQLPVSIPQKN